MFSQDVASAIENCALEERDSGFLQTTQHLLTEQMLLVRWCTRVVTFWDRFERQIVSVFQDAGHSSRRLRTKTADRMKKTIAFHLICVILVTA
jgi:hypothetical protein